MSAVSKVFFFASKKPDGSVSIQRDRWAKCPNLVQVLITELKHNNYVDGVSLVANVVETGQDKVNGLVFVGHHGFAGARCLHCDLVDAAIGGHASAPEEGKVQPKQIGELLSVQAQIHLARKTACGIVRRFFDVVDRNSFGGAQSSSNPPPATCCTSNDGEHREDNKNNHPIVVAGTLPKTANAPAESRGIRYKTLD